MPPVRDLPVRPVAPLAVRLRPLSALVGFALLVLAGGAARAQSGIPPRPNPPRLVNDFVGVLAPGEREALERKLVALDDSAGAQVAVVIVPTTDGVSPNEYATALGRAWGVGQAGVNSGVVLLVAMEDREVYIATGYGAEGGLTDGTAGTIVRSIIVPRFRDGNVYGGLDGAVDAIAAALAGEFEPAPAGGSGDEDVAMAVTCCFLLILVFVLVTALRAGRGGRGGGRRRSSGFPGVVVLPGGFSGGGGGFGGGFGGGGGFSGGGFGGFGGGSFGGGGAGGSW